MAQSIAGLGFKGSGLVGVFIIAGIILLFLKPESGYADMFLKGGFGLGIILLLLGVFAVAKRVLK